MHLTYAIIILLSLSVAFVLMRASSKHKIPVILTFICICTAVGIYFLIGNADYADQPYKDVQQKEENLKKLSVDELITLYEKGLRKKDSPQARLVLGNLLRRIGRLEQARTHFQVAYDTDTTKNPVIAINYADIMIALNKGTVSKQAIDIIDNILQTDASHPQALLYKGLYKIQNNQKSQAIAIWQKLLIDTKDEPFYPMLQDSLETFLEKYTIPPSDVGLERKNQAITATDLPMIEAMVQSLRDKVAQDPTNQQLQQRLSEVTKKLEAIKKNIRK